MLCCTYSFGSRENRDPDPEKERTMRKVVKGVLIVAAACLSMLPAHLILAGETGGHAPQAKGEPESVRTLEGYVEQEKEFYDYLRKVHPIFKYEKAGKMIGKYQISDREEEFVEFGGGKDYAKQVNMQTAMTYRLGMESILDLPNKFVGAKKCGECHPAQYEKWSRSRHALVVRFPDEMVELPNKDLKAPLYGSKELSVLPKGITPDMVYAIIGTPRTKYGYLDAWLVRGTYHIEDGLLRDLTGTLVAGGNQHSRQEDCRVRPRLPDQACGFRRQRFQRLGHDLLRGQVQEEFPLPAGQLLLRGLPQLQVRLQEPEGAFRRPGQPRGTAQAHRQQGDHL
jgi:hypothetical protein